MEAVVIENEKQRNRIIPHIFTILILILMITFIIISKSIVMHESQAKDIPTLLTNINFTGNKELNPSEGKILSMLYSSCRGYELSNSESKMYLLYKETLRKHLCNTGVNLSTSTATEVEEKIINLQEIWSSEKYRDITHMSVDGSKIAKYLSKQIYELCGLKLEYSIEGNITEITDQSGGLLYTYNQPDRQENIQFDALVITLVVIVTLLCFCIMIAKRNQLFVKGVEYDGFDEERFA